MLVGPAPQQTGTFKAVFCRSGAYCDEDRVEVQFNTELRPRDAIGNHVLQLRQLFRRAGFESEIFFEHLDPRLIGEGRQHFW